MEYIIKEFISKMSEDDIKNFGLKNNIVLTNDETRIIYMYIKNYWQVFYKEDPSELFMELKEKLRPEVYEKTKKLYDKYKKVI